MLCEKFDENSWKKLIKINENHIDFSQKTLAIFTSQKWKTSSNKYYSLILILTCDSIWKLIFLKKLLLGKNW